MEPCERHGLVFEGSHPGSNGRYSLDNPRNPDSFSEGPFLQEDVWAREKKMNKSVVDRPPRVEVGQLVWARLYNDLETDFMKVPLTVIAVHPDGSWDGELIEGEA